MPQSDRGSQRPVVRGAEHRLDRLLLPDQHGGKHTAQTFGPGREQDAPRERVHRGPAGEGVSVEIAVDRGQCAQIGEHDQQHWHPVEVGGKALAGRGEQFVGGRRHGRGLDVDVVARRPRPQAGRAHGQVVAPARQVKIAEQGPGVGILDQHHVPGLGVCAAGRESRRIQDARHHLVGDRVGGELTYRAGGSQRLDQVHRATLRTSWAGVGKAGSAEVRQCRNRADPPTGTLVFCRPVPAGPP